MKTTLRFILLTAIRDRLFPALLLLIIAVVGITSALSSTAMLEEQQMHLAMSAGLSRLIIAIGMATFVCFHIRALYDSREIDVMLSRPLSRAKLVVGLWAGFSIVASLLVLAVSLIILLLGAPPAEGTALWIGSVLLENWIVVAIALFASLTGKSAVTSVLVSFTLYVLGRIMAFLVATANSKTLFKDKWLSNAAEWTVELISVVIPRLDMFGHTDWLIYGASFMDAQFVLLQSAIFIPFVLVLAIIDLNKKQF